MFPPVPPTRTSSRARRWQPLTKAIGERLERYKAATGGLALALDFEKALGATIQRFNGFASGGRDFDFKRGERQVELLFNGTVAPSPSAPNPTMFPIAEEGPFYAALLTGGNLDTKGGPKTNVAGQVVDDQDKPIPGLYGVGDCAWLRRRRAPIGPAARPSGRFWLSRISPPQPRTKSARSGRNSIAAAGKTLPGLSGEEMHGSRQTNNDRRAKEVGYDRYLKAFDRAGMTSDGGSILDLFAEDAQVYFPKWGLANGKEEIGQMFGDIGSTLKSIVHHYSNFNYIFSGSDLVVCEGTSEASIATARGAPALPSMAPAAGATSSRSATGKFIAAHLSRSAYAGKTRRAIRG